MHEPVTGRISTYHHTNSGIITTSQVYSVLKRPLKLRVLSLVVFVLMLSQNVFGAVEVDVAKSRKNYKPEQILESQDPNLLTPAQGMSNSRYNNLLIEEVNKLGSSDLSISSEFSSEKSSGRFLAEDSSAVNVKPKEHSQTDSVHLGSVERQILQHIEDKPLRVTGEVVDLSFCEHDCNSNGVCQEHFAKTKVSENPDTFSYEPKYS